MGLSAFGDYPPSSSYCTPSADRSLTARLIELSNSPPKLTASRFSHTPEWADGLDLWSLSQTNPAKSEITRRHLDFHRDLGLYLPRHEKPNSAPTSLKGLQIHSKIPTNNFTPERIRQLLRKEKDLLSQHDLSDQPLPPSPPVPANTFRQSTSEELLSSNETRPPFRQAINKSPLSKQQHQSSPSQLNSSLNQDTLKSLLKEHLTSLLTRGASTINSNRTSTHVSTGESKQQTRTDSKVIEERLAKFEELIPTQPIPSQPMRTTQTSPFMLQPRSTLGLTVTPVDLTPQRNFQSVSLEKMAQQRSSNQDNDSSSVSSSRPTTQPAPFPHASQMYQYQQQQQRIILRRNFDGGNSSTGDILIPSDNSTKLSDQAQSTQQIRKGLTHHHRSTSKTGIHRVAAAAPTIATTLELLPPIISGKRLHIPLAHHRYL